MIFRIFTRRLTAIASCYLKGFFSEIEICAVFCRLTEFDFEIYIFVLEYVVDNLNGEFPNLQCTNFVNDSWISHAIKRLFLTSFIAHLGYSVNNYTVS